MCLKGLICACRVRWCSKAFNVFFILFCVTGEEFTMNPFRWEFVGKNLVCMAAEGFVYFILNLLIQYKFFLNYW